MLGKNVFGGLSRILDIKKIRGRDPRHILEKWDTWIEPSFYKTFLLTTTTSQRGRRGLLILES